MSQSRLLDTTENELLARPCCGKVDSQGDLLSCQWAMGPGVLGGMVNSADPILMSAQRIEDQYVFEVVDTR